MSQSTAIVPYEIIEGRIVLLRGKKVMLSPDLAQLYGVEPRALLQAVRRNLDRFPEDFMFRLSWEESQTLLLHGGASPGSVPPSRSQSVTLKRGQNIKYLPFAFTQEGIAMLSSVLRSPRAIQVNIEIMRAFVRLRQLLATHADLARKLTAMEKKYDAQFKVVFDALRALMMEPEEKKKPIGFAAKEAKGRYRK
jgi:hypothetical protein